MPWFLQATSSFKVRSKRNSVNRQVEPRVPFQFEHSLKASYFGHYSCDSQAGEVLQTLA